MLQTIDNEFAQFCRSAARDFINLGGGDPQNEVRVAKRIVSECKPYLLYRLQREFPGYLRGAHSHVYDDRRNDRLGPEQAVQYENIGLNPYEVNMTSFIVIVGRQLNQVIELRNLVIQDVQPDQTHSNTRK